MNREIAINVSKGYSNKLNISNRDKWALVICNNSKKETLAQTLYDLSKVKGYTPVILLEDNGYGEEITNYLLETRLGDFVAVSILNVNSEKGRVTQTLHRRIVEGRGYICYPSNTVDILDNYQTIVDTVLSWIISIIDMAVIVGDKEITDVYPLMAASLFEIYNTKVFRMDNESRKWHQNDTTYDVSKLGNYIRGQIFDTDTRYVEKINTLYKF